MKRTTISLVVFITALAAWLAEAQQNTAVGKAASQSGSYNSLWGASLAVDGKTNSRIWDNSCSHTNLQKNPWWLLDLGAQNVVYNVTILNRDESFGRLRDFTIRVGDNGGSKFNLNPICKVVKQRVRNGATQSWLCDNAPLAGRYISIQVNNRRDYLTLCEVSLPNLYIKPSSCQPYRFGPNCQWTCRCADNAESSSCANRNGKCPKGCAAGYTGLDCQKTCPSGWYGLGCKSKCRCIGSNVAACNPVTGQICNFAAGQRCEAGWSGQYCDQGNIGDSENSNCQQISTAFYGVCKRAIDGNTSPYYWNQTCSHTGLENRPWWKVDIGYRSAVNSVVIRNRAGVSQAVANRLSNIEVRVGNNWENIDANNLCNIHTAAAGLGEEVNIQCIRPLSGRYVSVRLLKNQAYLTMCEVKINGYLYRQACPTGRWGSSCQSACGRCNSGTCDSLTGVCKSGICQRGWRGSRCDKAVICPSGWTPVHNSETSCYKLLPSRMNQANGMDACQRENSQYSRLLALETAQENKAVYDWAVVRGIGNLITSGECMPPTETDVRKRQCTWKTTEKSFVYYKWAQGEPNGNGPVIQLRKANNYDWDDVPRTFTGQIVCEWIWKN